MTSDTVVAIQPGQENAIRSVLHKPSGDLDASIPVGRAEAYSISLRLRVPLVLEPGVQEITLGELLKSRLKLAS